MNCPLLDEFAALGVQVMALRDSLVIQPASKVPPELKERLRAHKAEVLAVLKKADEERRRRSEAEGARTEPTGPPSLGRLNEQGQLVLTLEDMPRLAEKLRQQGWIVKRVGDELDCQPRRPWSRVQ
jgi:hypothetical protein